MSDYPRLVFRCPGPLPRAGGTYDHRTVVDDAQLSGAFLEGWSLTLPDAIAGVPPPAPIPEGPPTRAELEQKATELGIKFDGRWGDQRLLQAINAKISP